MLKELSTPEEKAAEGALTECPDAGVTGGLERYLEVVEHEHGLEGV